MGRPVVLSDEMDSVLSKIADRQKLPKNEALQRAVALLKYLDDANANGETIIVKGIDGEERQIVFEPKRD